MAPEDKILQRFAMERQVSDAIICITSKDTPDIRSRLAFNKISLACGHVWKLIKKIKKWELTNVYETDLSAKCCFISQRVHDKKDVYNLNEDEELTHYGQSLAEMEKFNDLVNSDDESEEKGLLSGEYRLESKSQMNTPLIWHELTWCLEPFSSEPHKTLSVWLWMSLSNLINIQILSKHNSPWMTWVFSQGFIIPSPQLDFISHGIDDT